ncbi:MAG: carboxymuconolactone decarboxylase family protein [Planctomycetes bacterium]|nr:carboxymuconolactone decarboxylase family protein [Planctomycetota bacterium]
MELLRELAGGFPDAAKDLRLNLTSVLGESTLSEGQRWLVALSCALSKNDHALARAIVADAGAAASEALVDDAKAVAALMAMNNVYYRFRHMVGKETYSQMPARLRMNRLGSPKTSKADFELASLAVSALAGCEMCVRAHEQNVLAHGLGEAQVHDAVRIAAAIAGASTANSLAGFAPAGV